MHVIFFSDERWLIVTQRENPSDTFILLRRLMTAAIWLEYCRCCVKHITINLRLLAQYTKFLFYSQDIQNDAWFTEEFLKITYCALYWLIISFPYNSETWHNTGRIHVPKAHRCPPYIIILGDVGSSKKCIIPLRHTNPKTKNILKNYKVLSI